MLLLLSVILVISFVVETASEALPGDIDFITADEEACFTNGRSAGCALSLLQQGAVAKQGSEGSLQDSSARFRGEGISLAKSKATTVIKQGSPAVLETTIGVLLGALVGGFGGYKLSWPITFLWLGGSAGGRAGWMMTSGNYFNPYTVEENGFVAYINNPEYLRYMSNYSNTALQNQYIEGPVWPGHLYTGVSWDYWVNHWRFHFPWNGLFTWGDIESKALYVFIPGHDAFCTMYAPTLEKISREGYYVLCPQLIAMETTRMTIMKPVLATEWVLTQSQFSSIVVGGHSAGASAVPAATRVLLSRGINVTAMVMLHPGIVEYMNVPGCAEYFTAHPTYLVGDSYAETELYNDTCATFFPPDLMVQLKAVKLLVVAGSFCEWSAAQNSNWYSIFKCYDKKDCNNTYGNATGEALNSFPTPPDRPGQATAVCESGCYNAQFLANPGDCMFGTDANEIFHYHVEPLLKVGHVTFFSGCGDHGYSTYGFAGSEQDGLLSMQFLQILETNSKTDYQQFVQSFDGSTRTCHAARNQAEACQFPLSPFAVEPQKTWAESNKEYLCSENPIISVTHKVSALSSTMMTSSARVGQMTSAQHH